MEPTSDPEVKIEARGPAWVRYARDDGRRWEVHGLCDRRGDCLIGAVLADGTTVRDHDHLATLGDRPDSPFLDVPVTPEFAGCCPFTFVELP